MTVPLLVVDDSSFARKQVIRALPPSWPVEVSQAGNGEAALALIEQGKGEVVLLDLTMPVMDGFGVLENIRANQGKIRREVGNRLKNLRKIPDLVFHIDDSLDYAMKIDELLKKK